LARCSLRSAVPPVLALVAGAVGGTLYPKSRYDGAAKRRRRDTRRTLPEALDLLNVCLAAGKTIVPGLAEVVRRVPGGVVRDELARVCDAVQVGRPLDEALTDLARRAPGPEVEAFARAIVQANRLGANIAETLAGQADAARAAYEADLDVRTGKLATTLFIPILLFILPCLLGVMLGPALVSIGGQL
jgi:tight adherence protein C